MKYKSQPVNFEKNSKYILSKRNMPHKKKRVKKSKDQLNIAQQFEDFKENYIIKIKVHWIAAFVATLLWIPPGISKYVLLVVSFFMIFGWEEDNEQ